MPELKRGRNCAWEGSQKFLHQLGVRLHIWRQLEQQWSQLFRTGQWLDRAQKARNEIFGLLQAFDVRDDLVCLDAETKSGRCGLDPLLGNCFLQQLAKSKVDFDRVQLRRIILQKFCLGKLGGIKVRLPTWISPSRCTRIELRHGFALPKPMWLKLKISRIIPSGASSGRSARRQASCVSLPSWDSLPVRRFPVPFPPPPARFPQSPPALAIFA